MNAVYLGDKPTKTGAVVNADEIPLLDSQDLSSGRKKVKKVTAANLKASIGGVQSVVAGTNVTINNTDPANPVISASGGGGAKEFRIVLRVNATQIVSQIITKNTLGVNPSITYDGNEIAIQSVGAFPTAKTDAINTSFGIADGNPFNVYFGDIAPDTISFVVDTITAGTSTPISIIITVQP